MTDKKKRKLNAEANKNVDEREGSKKTQDVAKRTSKSQNFFHETRSEMKKVSWPKRDHVINSTVMIIIITIFFSVFVAIFDSGFTRLIETFRLI